MLLASVAAQLFEANPRLSGREVRRILIGTATRIPHAGVDRQGWGVINPREAVRRALEAGSHPSVG